VFNLDPKMKIFRTYFVIHVPSLTRAITRYTPLNATKIYQLFKGLSDQDSFCVHFLGEDCHPKARFGKSIKVIKAANLNHIHCVFRGSNKWKDVLLNSIFWVIQRSDCEIIKNSMSIRSEAIFMSSWANFQKDIFCMKAISWSFLLIKWSRITSFDQF